jgi:hypothetical protein
MNSCQASQVLASCELCEVLCTVNFTPVIHYSVNLMIVGFSVPRVLGGFGNGNLQEGSVKLQLMFSWR